MQRRIHVSEISNWEKKRGMCLEGNGRHGEMTKIINSEMDTGNSDWSVRMKNIRCGCRRGCMMDGKWENACSFVNCA